MPESTPMPAIYSQNIKTKGKTYFFDVRQARNGNKYLTISESWIKDGLQHRGSVTVFADHMAEFSQAVEQMQEKVR